MSLNLASVDAKLKRARNHAEALKNEVRLWYDRRPYSITHETNADFTRYSVILHMSECPDFERWSLMLGDSIHNLRAALDHLVYAIASCESGKESPPDEDVLAFPICDTPDKFSVARRRIRSLSCLVRTAIEGLQPYNRSHPKIPPLLSILRDFDDADKHRLLRLAASGVACGELGFSGNQSKSVTSVCIYRCVGEVKDGTELAAFIFDAPNPDMKYDKTIIDIVVAVWHGKRDQADPPDSDRSDFAAILSMMIEEVELTIRIVSMAVALDTPEMEPKKSVESNTELRLGKLSYGVLCKTSNCSTGIILGEYWLPMRTLHEGERFISPLPKTIYQQCEICRQTHEYGHDDIRTFEMAEKPEEEQ